MGKRGGWGKGEPGGWLLVVGFEELRDYSSRRFRGGSMMQAFC